MYEVLTYVRSDLSCLQLSSPLCALSLLSWSIVNLIGAVSKLYAVECTALSMLGPNTGASGLQFVQ